PNHPALPPKSEPHAIPPPGSSSLPGPTTGVRHATKCGVQPHPASPDRRSERLASLTLQTTRLSPDSPTTTPSAPSTARVRAHSFTAEGDAARLLAPRQSRPTLVKRSRGRGSADSAQMSRYEARRTTCLLDAGTLHVLRRVAGVLDRLDQFPAAPLALGCDRPTLRVDGSTD